MWDVLQASGPVTSSCSPCSGDLRVFLGVLELAAGTLAEVTQEGQLFRKTPQAAEGKGHQVLP